MEDNKVCIEEKKTDEEMEKIKKISCDICDCLKGSLTDNIKALMYVLEAAEILDHVMIHETFEEHMRSEGHR